MIHLNGSNKVVTLAFNGLNSRDNFPIVENFKEFVLNLKPWNETHKLKDYIHSLAEPFMNPLRPFFHSYGHESVSLLRKSRMPLGGALTLTLSWIKLKNS